MPTLIIIKWCDLSRTHNTIKPTDQTYIYRQYPKPTNSPCPCVCASACALVFSVRCRYSIRIFGKSNRKNFLVNHSKATTPPLKWQSRMRTAWLPFVDGWRSVNLNRERMKNKSPKWKPNSNYRQRAHWKRSVRRLCVHVRHVTYTLKNWNFQSLPTVPTAACSHSYSTTLSVNFYA